MSAPKIVYVQESIEHLRRLLKDSSPFISPRIKMLIEIKKNEGNGISKRVLAELIGVNHNSIQTWRKLYVLGGTELLISHKKTGYKPTLITKQEHDAIKTKLQDPQNGIRGYTELMTWIENEFKKSINYNTLYKYCVREFSSSVKVARKSHIKKDAQAVEAFKKTSVKSVAKPLQAKKGRLKK